MEKETIQKYLNLLPFVKWDRYTENEVDDCETEYVFYGWIDRAQDQYKDFVTLTIKHTEDSEYQDVSYTTSSAGRSREIGELLGFPDDTHMKCKRIETDFVVDNYVRL